VTRRLNPSGAVSFLILLALICLGVFAEASTQGEVLKDSSKLKKVNSMYAEYKESFPEVPDISAEQVLRHMEEGRVVFVDVRGPKEQDVSMLPGAITEKAFLKNPDAYKDYRVIGYCTISYRSGKLAQRLKKKGIDMFNLEGGILAWLHAGGKVYRHGKPVNRVHVYGKKWDLAPSGYETVR
jgi:rhodanese-related sulfurtransferase